MAKATKSYDVPVIGIAGSVSRDSDAAYQHGIDALFSIVPGAVPLEDAFEHAAEYMERTARDIAKIHQIGENDISDIAGAHANA